MKRITFILAALGLTQMNAQVTVLNGASFRTDQPVAAGSWATAFGAFTGVANAQATAVPLPKTLGGVTVTVDGMEAPLYFVSATQMNFLIPGAATAGLKDVQIRTAGATVNGKVRVVTTGPGLFTKDNTISPPRGGRQNPQRAIRLFHRFRPRAAGGKIPRGRFRPWPPPLLPFFIRYFSPAFLREVA